MASKTASPTKVPAGGGDVCRRIPKVRSRGGDARVRNPPTLGGRPAAGVLDFAAASVVIRQRGWVYAVPGPAPARFRIGRLTGNKGAPRSRGIKCKGTVSRTKLSPLRSVSGGDGCDGPRRSFGAAGTG